MSTAGSESHESSMGLNPNASQNSLGSVDDAASDNGSQKSGRSKAGLAQGLAGKLYRGVGRNKKTKQKLQPIALEHNDPALKRFFKSISKNYIMDEEKLMSAVRLRFKE